MIIIQIAGGLGDQMSRYALGRQLAINNQTDLFLDTSFYHSKHNFAQCDTRFFALDNFQIKAPLAGQRQISQLKTNRYLRRLGFLKPSHINKEFTDDEAADFKVAGDCYVESGAGTLRPWSAIRPVLLREFTLKEEFKLDDRLVNSLTDKAVALHCRRGDKANSPQVNRIHGVCSPDYYQRAVNYLQERLGDFNLLIFSDEPEWARDNLKFNQPAKFAVDYKLTDSQELILMSRCAYQIIANSSFSWWAAWLNTKADKIIIAPQELVKAENLKSNDYVSDEWIRL